MFTERVLQMIRRQTKFGLRQKEYHYGITDKYVGPITRGLGVLIVKKLIQMLLGKRSYFQF